MRKQVASVAAVLLLTACGPDTPPDWIAGTYTCTAAVLGNEKPETGTFEFRADGTVARTMGGETRELVYRAGGGGIEVMSPTPPEAMLPMKIEGRGILTFKSFGVTSFCRKAGG